MTVDPIDSGCPSLAIARCAPANRRAVGCRPVMPQWLSSGRYADRLFASARDVMDAIRGPSAYAIGILAQFLEDALADEEGMTQNASDAAMYAARFGYAVRLVEEAHGTSRQLDADTVRRLEQARQESPERRQALLDAALAESESETDRAFLKQLHAAGDGEYAGENEVLEELVRGEGWSRWFEGNTFFKLSGYSANVWQIMALKAAEAVNTWLGEEDSSSPAYPWTAVSEFLRLGYVMRCGDAFIGYVPERVEGGDWAP